MKEMVRVVRYIRKFTLTRTLRIGDGTDDTVDAVDVLAVKVLVRVPVRALCSKALHE